MNLVAWLLLAACCCLPSHPQDTGQKAARPAPVRVRLVFAGDVMQHMPQVTAARRGEGFDYGDVFAGVKPRFEAADIAVVNLETTLTRDRNYSGYPCFRSPAALAGALRDAGVDVAVMANNHCCDGGRTGAITTAEVLDSYGIRRAGVFVDSLDYVKNNPLHLTRRGIRFALLNYTYGTNGIPAPEGIRVNTIDTLQMAADLTAARDGGAESVVVCIHWGNEYQRQPDAAQRRIAAFLREHGANIVIGSHPHVVQSFEVDSSHVVFYSLGNFVSNQRNRYTDGGLLAEVDVVKYPDGRISYSAQAVPVWVALPRYRVLPPETADTMSLSAAYGVFRRDTELLVGSGL